MYTIIHSVFSVGNWIVTKWKSFSIFDILTKLSSIKFFFYCTILIPIWSPKNYHGICIFVDLGDDGGGVVKLEKLELLLLQIYSFSLVQHTLVSRMPGVDLNIDMNFVPPLLIFFNSGYTFLEAMWSKQVLAWTFRLFVPTKGHFYK